MPREAVTTAVDARVRISRPNIAAAQPIATTERRTLTAQINLILDQWRESLRSGAKMPRRKP